MLPRTGSSTVLTFASESIKRGIDQNQSDALNCQTSVSDGLSFHREAWSCTLSDKSGLGPREQGMRETERERERDENSVSDTI